MLELHINQIASAYTARWHLDGSPPGSDLVLDGATVRRLELARIAFQNVFDSGVLPFADPEAMRELGNLLYDTFFRPLASDLRVPGEVLIHSEDLAFYNLPWELIWLPGSNMPIGCDPNWAVLRVPARATPSGVMPDAGPLRLLFLAAAPEGDLPLDYEREEEVMLRVTERLDRNIIVLPFAESGTIKELADRVARHRPHVVHLSGHGTVDEKGVGWFSFEDERGQRDLQPADVIANRVFRGSAVRCVVLNACRAGQAAAAGLAGHLAAVGVPIVLGWGAPVLDQTATRFVATFYRFLAAGDSVPAAAAKARHDLWRNSRMKSGEHELWDATFALPWLFATDRTPVLIDSAASPQKYEGPKTELMLLGDEIQGLREGFIGRRREQQELIPPMRDGTCTVAVLTGIGGMGKSTLATRAAGRLKEAGFEVAGIKVFRAASAAEAGRRFLMEKLLPALALPFMAPQPNVYKAIRNGEFPVEDRIQLAVAEWKKLKRALVIDNFEDVLDEQRNIADEGLRKAYRILTLNLTGGSRLLVTCRYLPADTPDPRDAPHLQWRDLRDLKEVELEKFLRRDAAVEARIRAGEIPRTLIQKLHRIFGGTPGFLVQVRALLAHADLDGWDEDLPTETPLEEARQRYCDDIMLPRLYARLSAAEQTVVSRLAVSELPLPVDIIAQVAEMPAAAAMSAACNAANQGLVQVFAETEQTTLYHVHGLIRAWLTASERLPDKARQAVDAALAKFWQMSYQQAREYDLQVNVEAVLLACRSHAEHAGLREVFRWATLELVARLTAVAEWQEARNLLNEFPEPATDADFWRSLATIELLKGTYPTAREYFEKALSLQQAASDREGIAGTKHQLATVELLQGNHHKARGLYREALDLGRESPKRDDSALQHNLALIELRQGNYRLARTEFHKALTIQQAKNYQTNEANTWHNLASIELFEGNYAEARNLFGKALQLRQATGDKVGEALTLNELANTEIHKGDYTAARELLDRATSIRQGIGDTAGQATTLHNRATIAMREGKYRLAQEWFDIALAMYQEVGDKVGESQTVGQLGFLALNQGNLEKAREQFITMLALCNETGDRVGEAMANHNLASVLMSEMKYAEAKKLFIEVRKAREAIGDKMGLGQTLHQLATLEFYENNLAGARQLFAEALSLRQAIGDKPGIAQTLHNLATIELYENDLLKARDLFLKGLAATQETGHLAGEAAAWHQLGYVAWLSGRPAEGILLVSISHLMMLALQHADAKSSVETVLWMSRELGYGKQQLAELAERARIHLVKDRGAALLKAAFDL